jgi:hypothetical protein
VVFVAVQPAWVLRPCVACPGLPVRFFREQAWSHACVVVVRDVLMFFTGRCSPYRAPSSWSRILP